MVTIEVTPQTVITAFGVLGAVVGLTLYFAKAVRWFDRQNEQDSAIKKLEHKHNDDVKALQKELSIITYGLLACLKGLKEQGCNGPVSDAINRIEKFLNTQAHDRGD